MRNLRLLKWFWFSAIALGLVMRFVWSARVGYGLIAGAMVLVGMWLALNVRHTVTDVVDENLSKDGPSASVLLRVGHLRLFGAFFGTIGAVLLFMAVTGKGVSG